MSQQPPEYGIAPPMHEMPKSPKWPWILLVIVAALTVGGMVYGPSVMSIGGLPTTEAASVISQEPVSSAPPKPATRTVVFEVTGTGTASSITATAGASVQHESNVSLPWTRTVEMRADRLSEFVTLIVVAGADGAEVRGRYTIDGTTVREGKASGPYGVLTITDQ
jgi:Mycobacterium membrane protein